MDMFPLVLFSLLTITVTVSREQEFYLERNWLSAGLTEKEENLTYAINQYFRGYDIVLFSDTEEIPANPPMLLAKAVKRIYLIDEYSDIIDRLPDLNENVRRIFIIPRDSRDKILDLGIAQRLNEEKLIFISSYYEFYELKI